jgi:metal-dependent amidase/aminoacylase/carboxypeptidase family protein
MNQGIVANFAGELAAIRHDLHMHPELCFEEFRTGKIVPRSFTGLALR